MLKKRINKIKTKQKQRQKQMQIVNVNIHKPTRRPREGPPQPRRNVQQLPTPQYIYTSQTDSLVPQMFNKEGKQESMPTLSEQINKSLEEKLNKIASQYNISMNKPTQPTQQEVRQTRTTQFGNKPFVRNVLFNKPNKTTETKKPITYTNIFNEPIQDAPLTNIQYEKPIENAPILSKQEPETIFSYNTPAPISVNQAQGFEQKQGYSVKPRGGYESDAGYKTDKGTKKQMTSEQKDEMIKNRLALIPYKPEVQIPTLSEIMNKKEREQEEKEREQMEINDKESMRQSYNDKLFELIAKHKKLNKKLKKTEGEKEDAKRGSKGTYDPKIKEYKSDIKSINFKIDDMKNKISKL